ncbi:MAG TPA: maleylpyruvate isomerase N-terminal domain-containing protein [Luteitalea sp.]|nr:maleylpyruvate isomerase N-terminal domain-containing protein [Luteitalea sp.]
MIHTLHLFEELDDQLLALLTALPDDAWTLPTVAGAWTVRDVVAHLLDTPLRRLSFVRDGWPPRDVRVATPEDVVVFVNRLNADGVRVYGRLSPPVLIGLMATATAQLRAHLAAAAPSAPAAFAVSWAGEQASAHWFDVAREYTERWHHQAQIRLAVDALAPILSERLYGPVLATFVHALPYALRHQAAPEGTRLRYVVDGEGGGAWTLTHRAGTWRLRAAGHDPSADVAPPAAVVRVPAAEAWRVFTKGLTPEAIAGIATVEGDAALAAPLLAARAIVG